VRLAFAKLALLASTVIATPSSVADPLSFYRCERVVDGRVVSESDPCPSYRVSIGQLLARPDLFDGKVVSIVGFIHLEFEGRGLYPSQASYLASLTSESLWVGGFRDGARVHECQDAYVQIGGRFSARSHGHYGMWGGTLDDVSYCAER
jgi:hypothetical protein